MEINDQKLTAAEILALAMPKKRARAKRPTTRPATALRNVRNTENMACPLTAVDCEQPCVLIEACNYHAGFVAGTRAENDKLRDAAP